MQKRAIDAQCLGSAHCREYSMIMLEIRRKPTRIDEVFVNEPSDVDISSTEPRERGTDTRAGMSVPRAPLSRKPSRFQPHPYDCTESKSETRSDVSRICIITRMYAKRSHRDAKVSHRDAKRSHRDVKVSRKGRIATDAEPIGVDTNRYSGSRSRRSSRIFPIAKSISSRENQKTVQKTVLEPRYFRLTSIFDGWDRLESAEARRTDSRKWQVNP